MRKLGEFLTDLSFGPLAGHVIGQDASGVTDPAAEARLINYVNQGLSALHNRFNLYEREVEITILDGRTLYPLSVEHSISVGTHAEKFIVDTLNNPFSADVVKILEAWGPPDPLDLEGGMIELPIGDPNEENSIFLPSFDVIQIVDGTAGDSYRFLYQALHPLLGIGDQNQSIYLPNALFPALESWVASRILGAMNSSEHRDRGRELFQEYSSICDEVFGRDTANSSQISSNNKFEDRGFK